MQRDALLSKKSVKFSPATSEDDSADEGSSKSTVRQRRPVRALKNASHLGIQPGLSNAHLVLRRYAQLGEEASPSSLSDEEEQELLHSPKVGPSQPVDRWRQFNATCHPHVCNSSWPSLLDQTRHSMSFALQRGFAITHIPIRCPPCNV